VDATSSPHIFIVVFWGSLFLAVLIVCFRKC